jgi:hypothetical protein
MHQKSELSQRAAAPTHMFDNNQPTMVRESQMAVQDQQASARQLREMDVNAIVSTSKKKSRQQPPPASRHRSVLTLDCVVPLFDMRATTSINIVDIIRSSREARPIQNMTTITTDNSQLLMTLVCVSAAYCVLVLQPTKDNNQFSCRCHDWTMVIRHR